jgi:hypothetical protein
MILRMDQSSAMTRLAISKGPRIALGFRASTSQSEIRFLEYRLHVAELWPESDRKQAVIEGILLRLNAVRTAHLT